ncbi:MAG TPA: hypothetical protein VFG68_08255 [Fimbriiglobus sp.]|nr:hypothetical protein [Fimbriiglobus sp.]
MGQQITVVEHSQCTRTYTLTLDEQAPDLTPTQIAAKMKRGEIGLVWDRAIDKYLIQTNRGDVLGTATRDPDFDERNVVDWELSESE